MTYVYAPYGIVRISTKFHDFSIIFTGSSGETHHRPRLPRCPQLTALMVALWSLPAQLWGKLKGLGRPQTTRIHQQKLVYSRSCKPPGCGQPTVFDP